MRTTVCCIFIKLVMTSNTFYNHIVAVVFPKRTRAPWITNIVRKTSLCVFYR